MAETVFTYDGETKSCTVCKSNQVEVKISKKNTPYLINTGDKSYHRTFGKDGKMHCVKTKAENEWIKEHDSLEGCNQGGGAPGYQQSVPGHEEPAQPKGVDFSKLMPVADNVGQLDTWSAAEFQIKVACERFTIIMYPTAIKFAKQMVGERGDPKDIRICAAGIMHDYANIYAILVDKKISKKVADQQKEKKPSNGIENIPDIEEEVIHPDDEDEPKQI